MKTGPIARNWSQAGGEKPPDVSPLVALEDISLGYDSAPVLTHVNLAIYPGNLVGLAGPNGSGKTTLFRTLLGLLSPLGGTLARNCPLGNFGYVPQSAALDPQFPLSVREIVEMGAYGRVKSFHMFPTRRKQTSRAGFRASRHGARQSEIFFCPLRRAKAARADRPRVDGRSRRSWFSMSRCPGVDEESRHSITDLLGPVDPRTGLGGIFFEP